MHPVFLELRQKALHTFHFPIIKEPTEPRNPSTPFTFQTSTTQASLDKDKANKKGKETHSGSAPHHLSLQNLSL